MRELTRSQIIKALECCEQHGNCQECPLSGSGVKGCMFDAMHEALELIKELVDEIKFQEEQYDRVYEQAEADIRGNMADGGTSCHWCIAGHKADVVKKMQDRMVMHFGTYTDKTEVKVVDVFKLMGQIAEEMLEENNV